MEFSENVNSGLKLMENSEQITSLQSLIDQARTWQVYIFFGLSTDA